MLKKSALEQFRNLLKALRAMHKELGHDEMVEVFDYFLAQVDSEIEVVSGDGGHTA